MKLPRTLLVVVVIALVTGAVALRLTAGRRGVAAAQRALDAQDLAGAEALWREALARDPSSAEALYGLGWTLHLAGRTDLARESFQQCVEAHPESPLGYKGLGSVAMASGNPALARERFGEALARAPGDPAIRQSLALLDLRTGHAKEAIAAFQELIAADPERPAFRQALAEALLVDRQDEEALDAAAEAIRLATDEPRIRAQAQVTRARALLAVSAGRVDPADCARTAPPVYAWLEAADQALDQAEATGIAVPELLEARRLVRQRRGVVDDQCPGVRAGRESVGRNFPGG